jgi:alkylation response protein AidB-like acyl-CoA dehydrogenase
MDFRFGDEQTAIQELARGIFEKEVSLDRLEAAEASPDRIDERLWSTLAEANLLGTAVPDAHGGMGLGLLELLSLCHEVGRVLAPVPVLPALVLGGLPIARFGTSEQQSEWLPLLAAGTSWLSAALDDAGSAEVAAPAATAIRDGAGWRLRGVKRFVPLGHRAARLLVPAASETGVGVFLVDPRRDGVQLTAARTSTHEPLFTLELADVSLGAEDRLGGESADGGEIARFALACGLLGVCAMQGGVSERALEITTGHLREREQFGAPIGSFPAVQQRIADAWIDLQAMRWTTWRAAWRLAEGLPAAREIAVAKFWAAEGGARIADTAQHQHGGLGVDISYPIHRYFLWSRALALRFGGASPTLARLGRELAAAPPPAVAGEAAPR